MQRKSNVSSQTLVTDMHFAVVPYEIEFLVPKDNVYQIYFEKGLQILGTTQYPIEIHQRTKKIQLPIANNIITFRLFSQRNSQYQWSIYKRVDDMQEFLETKKINLKDIIKKQPHKRIQTQKRNLERKQSMISRKNQVKSSQLKSLVSKTSELKTLESKVTEIKTPDQSSIQRFSEISSEGKGCIYDEQIKSDLGQFLLKFYVLKAFSNQDLNRAIEQICRQKKEQRKSIEEININKVAELPKISEISANVQEEVKMDTKVPQQVEQVREDQNPPQTVIQEQKGEQKVIIKEMNQEKLESEMIPKFYEQKIEMTPAQTNEGYIQFVQERQTPEVDLISSKVLQENPIIDTQNQVQERQNGGQPIQVSQQQEKVETTVEIIKTPKFSIGKKMFILGLILMIVLYALYSLNVFEKISFPAKKEVPKKGKKERFSNRKKASK